jgi:Carboxypeptidase regulatory-like domain
MSIVALEGFVPLRLTQIAVAIGFFVCLPAAVKAQGSIGGVVRDTSGGVLPGVTVEASSPALIERTRTAVTDGNGQYSIVALVPGQYILIFSLPGFSTTKREALDVTTGVTLPVNAVLSVGAVQETVTVTSASPVVDIQNTTQGIVMNRETLDLIPRTRLQQQTGALLPGVSLSGAPLGAVGGSSGRNVGNVSAHGGLPTDQFWAIDGMKVFQGAAGDRRILIVSDNSAQELTFETGAHSAEIPTGGVVMNLVPREGGNIFHGTIYADFANGSLVSDNLSSDLKVRGLTTTTKIDKIWDVNPAYGGPLLRDRLWFFATFRDWGANMYPVDTFFLSNPTERALSVNKYWAADGRLTWQASPRNKFNLYYNHQGRDTFSISSLTPPEAADSDHNNRIHILQPKWTSPLTHRILLEVGGYYYHEEQPLTFSQYSALQQWEPTPSNPAAWPTQELSTGKWIAGSAVNTTYSPSFNYSNWGHERASVSYVTGSHAVKIGFTHTHGSYTATFPPVPPVLLLLNGKPFEVLLIAKPGETLPRLNHDLGVYAQDRWTIRRLTVNAGLRFDYFNGQVDAQSAEGTIWVPARAYPVIPDVPSWKDLSPRIGLAYDLLGNGKTALKVSVNRYVQSDATNFQGLVNPMGSQTVQTPIGLSDLRTWSDLNHDGIPQLNELGPSTNLAFGTPFLSTVPATNLRQGWGVRPYQWEYAAGLEHELRPGLSLNAGYFRRSFGNLYWTNNVAVQASDYVPFSIASPLTGDQITRYNLAPAKRGQVNNIIEFAPVNSNVFDGVDVYVNGRLRHGGRITGGVSMGRSVVNNCTVSDPSSLRFCEVRPPFMAGNQYKFAAGYPLPFGVEASGSLQSNPGPVIAANYTVSSAIAGIPITQGSLSVNLVDPSAQSSYGDRSNEVDLRFARNIHLNGTRTMKPYVDVFNALNASPVVALNTTYGPSWKRPTAVLVGRMVKIGVQLDF